MAREVTVIRGAVSPDHIHMLVAAPPQRSPSKLVQVPKGRSSRLRQQEFPTLRKRYWGQHLWALGYYCASVGAVDEATIRDYIENQRWDEDVNAFKITGPTEPEDGAGAGPSSGGFSRSPTFSRSAKLPPLAARGESRCC